MKTLLSLVAGIVVGIIAVVQLEDLFFKTGYHPLYPLTREGVQKLAWCDNINNRNVICPRHRWSMTAEQRQKLVCNLNGHHFSPDCRDYALARMGRMILVPKN